MDNGPAELCHQAPQEGKGVEAGGVAALESDLKRVLPDERYVSDPQLFVTQRLHARQPARRATLAAALRARARPAQLLTGIGRMRPVFPRDLHHLARAVYIDVGGKRVGVLQPTT